MPSNFEKLTKSVQGYVDKSNEKKAGLNHEHQEYCKRSELSPIALTGNFSDLTNVPEIPDVNKVVNKDEVKEMIASNIASDAEIQKILVEIFEKVEV